MVPRQRKSKKERERERVGERVQKEKEKRNERRLLQKNVVEWISPDSSHHFARTKPSNARPQRKKKPKEKQDAHVATLRDTRFRESAKRVTVRNTTDRS